MSRGGVTGAGSGIGRALALELAGRGVRLALSDVNSAALADTVASCEKLGVPARDYVLDVADRAAVSAHAEQVVGDFGQVNLVVNIAGVALVSSVEDMSYEDFDWIVGINFWGVVHGTKSFLPHLIASGEGHLVNISSVFGLIGVPTQSAYNATKFAVRGFTESLRQKMLIGRRPVGVSCVHPGGIRTNIARDARAAAGNTPEKMATDFARIARTSPQSAAKTIVRGIERNRARILVGPDAHLIDAAPRVLGSGYQRVNVAGARIARRLGWTSDAPSSCARAEHPAVRARAGRPRRGQRAVTIRSVTRSCQHVHSIAAPDTLPRGDPAWYQHTMSAAAIRWAVSVVVLVLTMGACSSALPPPPDATGSSAAPDGFTRTVSLAAATGARTAVVHRPGGLRAGMPLVVVLHGAFGSGEHTRTATGWDALADREGFMVAYPNGYGRTWNAGRCCGVAFNQKIDDVAFLHQLTEHLVQAEGVDRERVYAVGMSNGAMMAYAWACYRPEDLAGIGPVAGALVADCQPKSPVNVVALHGTADRNVPISGGVGPRSVTRYKYPSLAASVVPFVNADRCTPAPRRNDRAPLHVSTFNCVSGAGVTVAVVEGLGHEWPGARPADPVRKLLQEKVAPPLLDATTFLWSQLRGSSAIS